MPAQTPIFGIPYPLATDPVAAGAADMQGIATAVENLPPLSWFTSDNGNLTVAGNRALWTHNNIAVATDTGAVYFGAALDALLQRFGPNQIGTPGDIVLTDPAKRLFFGAAGNTWLSNNNGTIQANAGPFAAVTELYARIGDAISQSSLGAIGPSYQPGVKFGDCYIYRAASGSITTPHRFSSDAGYLVGADGGLGGTTRLRAKQLNISCDTNGMATVLYDEAFPNATLAVVATCAQGGVAAFVTIHGLARDFFQPRVWNAGGSPYVGTCLIHYIAIGY